MIFKDFAELIRRRFYLMAEEGPLFVVGIDKGLLFLAYQEAFPPGTNEIFRTNREHDCNCCNKFISRIGRVVKIVDGELMTVWGDTDKMSGKYKVVAQKMDELIKDCKIDRVFLMNPEDKNVSTKSNIEDLTIPRHGHDSSLDPKGIPSIKWYHFSCVVPDRFLSADKNPKIGDAASTKGVFKRGLEEITLPAIELALDLIDSNSIYRGEEFGPLIESFKKHKEAYSALSDKEKEYYTWLNYGCFSAKIRGTAIGTLLIDLSTGVELNDAVSSYEKKVAPENYKRTSAPITKGMVDKAIAKIDSLGLRDALERRYARLEDVSVNNVLFADRSASKVMKDVLRAILNDKVKEKPGKYDGAEEIPIEKFIKEIVPNCTNIEARFTNSHENNLMSLIAPVHASAPFLFKWDNNFSWAYNGDLADSLMKRRVKSMGGNIDAYLRFSIQWNEDNDNLNDFDAHAFEPGGRHIFYSNKGKIHPSSGHLDVDIVDPRGVAVENITYTNPTKMGGGTYKFAVHNYSHRGGRSGFRAEIEFDGIIHKFSYDKDIPHNQFVTVAIVSHSREGGLKIVESLPHDRTSKEIWGVKTEKFHRVNAIMFSPNHWDEQGVGNRHYFFVLDGCKNDGRARGFYNEFIRSELNVHRKVFEILGGKMKCEESESQISGLGFSSTKRNSVVVRTSGDITKTFKVIF